MSKKNSFLQKVVSVGYLYGLDRLLPAFVEDYGWTRAQAGLIQSTFAAVFCFIGVATGASVQRFGPKSLASVGSLLVGIPICLSFLSKSFTLLIVTHGIITAIGTSFAYISASVIVSGQYEGRSKSLALTVVSSGPGVGAMAYSYLIGYLLEQYGLRGTFLINGAIVLNGFAMTLAWPNRKKRRAEATVERNAETITTNGQTNLTEFKNSVFRTLRINSIVSITGNAPFILFAIGNALCQTALTVFTVYTVDVVTDQGGSQASGSFGLFLFSITSTIGRFVPGIMKQIPDVSVETASLLSSVLSFASTLLIVLVPSFTLTLVCICCVGLAFGVQAANISIATAKLIDDILMPTGMGLIFTIIGIGAVTYGPLIGYMRDTTGSYTAPFVCSSALLVVSAAFLVVAVIIRHKASPV